MQSIYDQLETRTPKIYLPYVLIAINVLVFVAMLFNGAGLWHASNSVPLAWGANFAPATQDGEWWRLGSAMFLHFGVIHLILNCYALWDAGQLAERMYGVWRLVGIYITAGLFGNVVSLVMNGNQAVSGGASGAIFGLYGAVLIFIWRERDYIDSSEFKWLFGGGMAFIGLTVALGLIISGIDNAAHIGGGVAGLLGGIMFARPINARKMPTRISIVAATLVAVASTALLVNLPAPKYKWSDELLVRSVIGGFAFENQAINRKWLEIQHDSQQGEKSPETLAEEIDQAITRQYESSFEKLSTLPNDPDLPSAQQLEFWLQFTEDKKNASEQIADQLRQKQQE